MKIRCSPRRYLRLLLGLALTIMLLGCQENSPPPSSRTNSILGDINGNFVTSEYEKDEIYAAVGILYIKSMSFEGFFCSSIHISPSEVMMNLHCLKAINEKYSADNSTRVFFTKDYRSLHASSYNIELTEDDETGVLFQYKGELETPITELDVTEVDFLQPIYQSTHLDATILSIATPLEGALKIWSGSETNEGMGITLLSHPSNLPLFQSDNCAVKRIVDSNIYHDCDSLPGSSGGLLIDVKTLRPVGLHRAGVSEALKDDNAWDFYQKYGRFRNSKELAEKYCNNRPFLPSECDENMMPSAANRAVLLKAIFDDRIDQG